MAERALHVSTDGWLSTPDIPVDDRGPAGHPFVPFPPEALDQPIAALLRQVVMRDPDAVAVWDREGALQYRAMWDRIGQLAVELGSHPAAVVGLLLPPSGAYSVALFACLAAGRICVPFDTTHPPDRIAQLAGIAGVGLMLVADETSFVPCGIVALPVSASYPVRPSATPAMCPLSPDAPAFILFTSGSTGQPKAIVHSQRTMLHMTRTNINSQHLNARDQVVSASSLGTLGGFHVLLRFALVGASIRTVDLAAGGLGELMDALGRNPVTVLRAGASLLRTFARLPGAAAALAGLRLVHTGGEALLRADLDLLREKLPRQCLIRVNYGCTEAGSIGWFANGPDDHDPVRVATGTLYPDTEAMIRGEDGYPCRPGEVGELLFRSRYNSLGEWSAGRLTQGRLRPDHRDPELRIYATGDLARCSEDGVFVVLGRKDRMVKVNGLRLEPSEIEAALRRHPEVAQAAAVLRQTGSRAVLRCFVVTAPDPGPELGERLRLRLLATLPAFMVPSRITVIDSLPLLPGGKLDEAALLSMS